MTQPKSSTPAQPPRPTRTEVETELKAHINKLAGPNAQPRPEQLKAVSAVAADGRRTLLVARTGFGKSAVYFSATRMLRDRGWGPTLVVSPLLALMRDQVASARSLGLEAETINSSNLEAWATVEQAVARDEVDLLLISPERLANKGFRQRVFSSLIDRPFALVCDEAHCISDWGHDFRPDYLRLRQLLSDLPSWTPVLATTATANQRVTDDVATQLGDDTVVLRTSLDRESLRLSVVDLDNDAQRFAWLAQKVPTLSGSGIIYCLTQNQAEQTAQWLQEQGLNVQAYTGATATEQREVLESQLRNNELKALTATSALGMGFDKGDMAFCIHFGLPSSPVAYYQQIGRAGRAIETAEVIALPRPVEDAAVWRWFEKVSLPPEDTCRSVLLQLDHAKPMSVAALETSVNLGRSRLTTLLKMFEVDGVVDHIKGGYILTDTSWEYDHKKAERLRSLRSEESEQMLAFHQLKTCRLRFLRVALDDSEAKDCGRCDRCRNSTEADIELDDGTVAAAQALLRGGEIIIEPRKRWPSGLDEPRGLVTLPNRAEPGRALARRGDGGWDAVVDTLIASASGSGLGFVDSSDHLTSMPATNEPSDASQIPKDLITAIADVLKRWDWPSRPTWICPVPSRRRAPLLNGVASTLGTLGGLAVHHPLHRIAGGGWQSDQSNSAHQVSNVWDHLKLDPNGVPKADVMGGPVLLIDDEAESRWTLTICAYLLKQAGAGPVLPFVLRSR